MMSTEFITGRELYERVILEAVPRVQKFLWIATADIKDLHVKKGGRMVPFLEILSDLVDRGVAIRLIHAKEPGPAFRKDFDKYANLIDGVERLLCPRSHFKCVIIDGRQAYSGSANLTGAGLGAKGNKRRNFESGILTEDLELIEPIMEQFDKIWRGEECDGCQRKEYCADFNEMR